jgi:hypothetical protein
MELKPQPDSRGLVPAIYPEHVVRRWPGQARP